MNPGSLALGLTMLGVGSTLGWALEGPKPRALKSPSIRSQPFLLLQPSQIALEPGRSTLVFCWTDRPGELHWSLPDTCILQPVFRMALFQAFFLQAPIREGKYPLGVQMGRSSAQASLEVLPGSRSRVQPKPIADLLPNPFTGFAPYVEDFVSDPELPQSLAYADVTWRQLETQRGQYDWLSFEKHWKQHTDLGRRIGFRLKLADPWIAPEDDVPDWLMEAGVSMRPYTIDGGSGRAPDWDDAFLLGEHDRLLEALGKRYDQDPRIAWVDVGSYGIWGEWHVYQNEHLAARTESKQRMLEAYLRAFPTKPLALPFDDPFATEYLTARGKGLRNDCLGSKESNDWYLDSLASLSPDLNDRAYLAGPITGEFCGSEGGALEATTTGFQETLAFVKKTHWSWIGPAGGSLLKPQNPQHRIHCEQLMKSMAYRYRVEEISHESAVPPGGRLRVEIQLLNEGVAPFYYPWPLELSLIDGSGRLAHAWRLSADLRRVGPGSTLIRESLDLPSHLVHGSYVLALAVLDPDKGQPALHLACEGRDEHLRYRLSNLKILKVQAQEIGDDKGAEPPGAFHEAHLFFSAGSRP